MRELPYFWPRAFDRMEWSVDARHLYWMYDFLWSSLWKRALEIGCHAGYSSSIFIDLLRRGCISEAHFCDVHITESLLSVVSGSGAVVHGCKSVDVMLAHDYDFIFVDGDHTVEGVEEELAVLLRRMPLALFAHDTGLEILDGQSGGPARLKSALQAMPGVYCLEDNRLRIGERTQRGMFFATTSLDLYAKAQGAMKKWCDTTAL